MLEYWRVTNYRGYRTIVVTGCKADVDKRWRKSISNRNCDSGYIQEKQNWITSHSGVMIIKVGVHSYWTELRHRLYLDWKMPLNALKAAVEGVVPAWWALIHLAKVGGSRPLGS